MAAKAKFSENCSVPVNILQGDVNAKIDYFRAAVVNHSRLSVVSRELDESLDCDDVQIILLCGPSGVGKSMVHGRKFEDIQERYAELMQKDTSMIPVLREEVRSARSHRFEWGSLAKSIIGQCIDISMNQRNLVLGDHSRFPVKEMQRVLVRKNSERELMDAMEETIRTRQVRYLFADEAHQIITCCSNQKATELYMETLKSISNKGGTKLVLAGSYELLRFLGGSGQLARRTKVINFSPYRAKLDGDLNSFEEAFLSLLGFYPIKVTEALLSKLQSLFLGSCGCIGILKQWMARALSRALSNNKDYVSWSDFEATRLQPMALRRIAKDICEGELLASSASMEEVSSLLGMSLPKQESSSGKPGERELQRDEVA